MAKLFKKKNAEDYFDFNFLYLQSHLQNVIVFFFYLIECNTGLTLQFEDHTVKSHLYFFFLIPHTGDTESLNRCG